MTNGAQDSSDETQLRQRFLSRWENEGGRVSLSPQIDATPGEVHIPHLTNTELVQLRVRVIALENLVIGLLACAPDQQRALIRAMADYISPQPGHTPHPLTVHAAREMVEMVDRAGHFHAIKA